MHFEDVGCNCVSVYVEIAEKLMSCFKVDKIDTLKWSIYPRFCCIEICVPAFDLQLGLSPAYGLVAARQFMVHFASGVLK